MYAVYKLFRMDSFCYISWLTISGLQYTKYIILSVVTINVIGSWTPSYSTLYILIILDFKPAPTQYEYTSSFATSTIGQFYLSVYIELSHGSPGLYNALTSGLSSTAQQSTQSAEERATETMKQMKRIEEVFTLAEQRRKAAEAKRIEKAGGFKFDQSLQIPMTFTFGSPTSTPQHPHPGHVHQTSQSPQQPAGFAFAPSGMANPFITPPHNNTSPASVPTFGFPPRTTPWDGCSLDDH